MKYAIDESNAQRQQLLAEMLNPLTRPVLERIPRDSIVKILDLGCGRGHTTRMLADQFPNALATGFEYDAALVAHASADPSNRPSTVFQQGDASHLPFPRRSFDLVFTHNMLVHVPDPSGVTREMFRVTRPGGFVGRRGRTRPPTKIRYPANAVKGADVLLKAHLFRHPFTGRQLVHGRGPAGAANYSAGMQSSEWTTIKAFINAGIG